MAEDRQTNQDEEGITLGEICRMIGKKIWLVLGISVLVAVLAALVVVFALNPRKKTYTMEFRLLFPASDTVKYADGAPFYYDEIISAKRVLAARDGDEAFASVDAESMIKNDDISIKQITVTSTTGSGTEIKADAYYITVSGRYFKNAAQAEDFIAALAEVSAAAVKENADNIDYTVEESVFQGSSLEERISLLRTQKELLASRYETWIEIYSSEYVVEGRTLQNYLSELNSVYGTSAQTRLQYLFDTNGFAQLDIVGYDTLEEAVAVRTAQLAYERDLNTSIIEALKEQLKDSPAISVDDYQSISEKIADYTARNTKIDYFIGADEVDGTLTAANVQAFIETLDAQYERLQAASLTASKVSSSLYNQNTVVVFDTKSVVTSGDISVTFAAGGGFVAAFVVCAVVVCIAERRKQKRGTSLAPEEARTSSAPGESGDEEASE